MGNLHTPLTNTPVVDWTDTAVGPDVPQSMMNALGSLERYANVPVADAPTRETLMPQAQRYIGQVTYNKATDTFEYWYGTRWQAVNQGAAMPSNVHMVSNPNVMIQPTAYYDYRSTLTVTSTCNAVVFAKAWATCSINATSWGGMTLTLVHNDDVWANFAVTDVFYSANPGIAQMDLTTFGRFTMFPGVNTLGVRVGAQQANTGINLVFVNFMAIRASGVANGGAGSNAFGDW